MLLKNTKIKLEQGKATGMTFYGTALPHADKSTIQESENFLLKLK